MAENVTHFNNLFCCNSIHFDVLILKEAHYSIYLCAQIQTFCDNSKGKKL
jgi:hypothetical protein